MAQYATVTPQLTGGGMAGWCWGNSLGDASGPISHQLSSQRYASDTDPWRHHGLLMTAAHLARAVHPDDKTYHLRGYEKPVDYYDNYLVSKCPIRDSSLHRCQQDKQPKQHTPSANRSTKNLGAFPRDLLQHRSMIELDPRTMREREETSLMSSSQAVADHKWVCQPHSSCLPNQMENSFIDFSPTFTRFTILELMQQEGCVSPTHYPVDHPSRIVRVECCKPGCRCVLKNESALALKIVPGLTLIRCYWLPTECDVMQPSISNMALTTGSTRRSCFSDKQQQQQQQAPKTGYGADKRHSRTPMIITSCFPGWFEVATLGKQVKTDTTTATVPVWSSCKAIWRAKPDMFLLHRDTVCYLAIPSDCPVNGSIKAEQLTINLYGDRSTSLPNGTVLRPIDCRLCRLNSGDHHSTSRRQRSKTVSMLQCSVVGARALASLSGFLEEELSSKDTLHWFKDGPRLVYLPWDVKSMQCSPVVSTSTTSFQSQRSKQSVQKAFGDNKTGLYSALSLLCQYQLPLTVHPILGFPPNEPSSSGRPTRKADDCNSYTSSGSLKNASATSLLHMEACFHGDLIFLEPIHGCSGADRKSSTLYRGNGGTFMENNQFFVVTTDMLANHNFLLAEQTSHSQLVRQLNEHAFRVAHFLCTPHPAEGLTYLVKHLEDITQSCNTGPSHTPLTRTLGPVDAYSHSSFSHVPICLDVVASLAAAAEIAQQDFEEITKDPVYTREVTGMNLTQVSGEQYLSTSYLTRPRQQTTARSSFSSLLESEADQMTSLCDELEDIYYYVRNGRFPTESRSLTTLVHQFSGSVHQLESTPEDARLTSKLPQTSAPISTQMYLPEQNGMSTVASRWKRKSKLPEDLRRSSQLDATLNPGNTTVQPILYAQIPGVATQLANGQYPCDQVRKGCSNNDVYQDFTVPQGGAFVLPRNEYYNAGQTCTMVSSHQPVIMSNGRGATRLFTNTKTLKLTPVASLQRPQPVSVNARLIGVPGTQSSVMLPVAKPSQSSCGGACLGATTLSHVKWQPTTSSQGQSPPWIMAQSMNEQLIKLPEAKMVSEQPRSTDQPIHLVRLVDQLKMDDSGGPGHSSSSGRQKVNPSFASTIKQHHSSNEQLYNSIIDNRGSKQAGQMNRNQRSGVLHFVPSALPYYPGREQSTLPVKTVLIGSSPSHLTMTTVSSTFHLTSSQAETMNPHAYRLQQPTGPYVFPMTNTFNHHSSTSGRSFNYQSKSQTPLRSTAIGSCSDPAGSNHSATPTTHSYATTTRPALATNAGYHSRLSDEHVHSGMAWTDHFTSSSPDTGIGVDSGGEMGNPAFVNPWQPKQKLDRLLSAEQLVSSNDVVYRL